MDLLLIRNRSHQANDDSKYFCMIDPVNDIYQIIDILSKSYVDKEFDRNDWSIVRMIDLKRVLSRILKSDHVEFIRYLSDKEDIDLARKQRKYKNQKVVVDDSNTTIFKYKKRKYDFGYDVNANDLLLRIKEESLFDMSDLLEIVNYLKIDIDWSRLDQDIVSDSVILEVIGENSLK